MKKALNRGLAVILAFLMLISSTTPVLAVEELLSINDFSIEFLSGAEHTANGYEYKVPSGGSLQSHRFLYRLNYSVSGDGELEPNSFVITVPTEIFTDRDGENATNYDVAVPYKGEVSADDTQTKFVYEEKDGTIRIYNRIAISTAEAGNIEIAFSTSKTAVNYVDMQRFADITANFSVNRGESSYTRDASAEGVMLNTSVKIGSTRKESPKLFTRWQASWGLERPADADDYYYLTWPVYTTLSNVGQYYNFTLTDIFNEPDTDVLGYKFQNKTTFTTNDTVPYQNASERYDYVLTRHKISTYSGLQSYTLNNSVTATVIPFDGHDAPSSADSNGDYNKSIPMYKGGNGHFWAYKDGLSSDDRLAQFKSGELDKISNLQYNTYVYGHSNAFTVSPSSDIDDPNALGQVKLTYETYDNQMLVNRQEHPAYSEDMDFLNPEDYEFNSVKLSIIMNGASFNEETQEHAVDKNINYQDTVEMYAYITSSHQYVKVAEYKPADHGYSGVNETYVSSWDGDTLYFKDGVDGCGAKVSTAAYYVHLSLTPSVTLFGTDNVREKLNNISSINYLSNIGKSRVSRTIDDEVTSYCDFVRVGSDAIRQVYRDSTMRHYVESASNNKLKSRYEVTWTALMTELEKFSDNEIHDYVQQNGGEFYVLLPTGAGVDKKTVTVSDSNGIIGSGNYTVKTVMNYNDTGRTLLRIKIRRPGRNFKISYTTYNTWENVNDYGALLESHAAYETGNGYIYNGSPDNGGGNAVMSNLDPDSDAERFLYANTSFSLVTLMATNTGMTLKVQSEEDQEPVYSTFVHQNQSYMYQVRAANDNSTWSKNLVFYDSLENYVYDGHPSDWKGKLKSVDVNNLIENGAAPVVYFSAVENLNIPTHLDLNATEGGSRIWLPASEFGDISRAKAVAVDCSKKPDGSDFVLGANESLVINMYMQAPASVNNSTNTNPETYNNIYLNETVLLDNEETQSGLLHQEHTTVNFRAVGDIKLKKVSSEDNTLGIEGITFKLNGDSVYGTHYDMSVTSDADGNITFSDIEYGEYTITETQGIPDYLADYNAISAHVEADGSVTVSDKAKSGDRYLIENTPRVHGDLEFIKLEKYGSTQHSLSGAQFTLYGKSDYGNDIFMTAQSDHNGMVRFYDLEKGRDYTLVESKYPDNMINKGEKYTVSCDSSGYVSIQELTLNAQGYYEIPNEPYVSLTIFKADAFSRTTALQGAKLRLTRADSGTAYDKTLTTNSNGVVRFDKLEVGSYILEETEAPQNYIRNTKKYSVTVPENHVVTIDGLVKNEVGFVFPNERALNGEIKITKQWLDDKSDEERPVPKIHISREEPGGDLPIATLSNSIFTKAAGEWGKNGLTSFDKTDEALTLEQAAAKSGAVKADDNTTDKSIYVWKEDDGAVKWWSDAAAVYFPIDCDRLFDGWQAVTAFSLNDWNTGKVTSMVEMFRGCSSLSFLSGMKSWDVSGVRTFKSMFENCTHIGFLDALNTWDVSSSKDFSRMFYHCDKIDSLNGIRNWRLDNALYTTEMFGYCAGLTNLNGLENLNTGSIKKMNGMFTNCSNIKTLSALSNWDISSVITLNSLFKDCHSLTSLNGINNWNTVNLKDLGYAFSGCSLLTDIEPLRSWNTGSLRKINYTFSNCANLTNLNALASWNTVNIRDMSGTFSDCVSLASIAPLASWNVSQARDMSSMFLNCKLITSLTDLSGWNVGKVNKLNSTFSGCSGLSSLTGIQNWDVSNVSVMNSLFLNGTSLTVVDLNSWDTARVSDMSNIFSGCSNVTSLLISNWNVSNVQLFTNAFLNCSKMITLDVSRWNMNAATDLSSMFNGCKEYANPQVEDWDLICVKGFSSMFRDCYAITELDLSRWNTSSATKFSNMFDGCQNLRTLNVGNWDTGNATRIEFMFRSCYSLTSLDVKDWDVSNVTHMSGVFSSTRQLRTIDISGWYLPLVTSSGSLFAYCDKLKTIYATNLFNSFGVVSTNMFTNCIALTGGNGTAFSSDQVTAEYARIDTNETPGYFTAPVVTPNTDAYPEISYAAFMENFNALSNADRASVTSFKRNTSKSLAEVQAISGVRRIDNGANSERVYMWAEGTDVYWWCSSQNVYLPKNCGELFKGCTSLTEVDTSGWDMSRVVNLANIFNGCSALTSLQIENWDVSSVKNMHNVFNNCTSLTALNLNNWDVRNVVYFDSMFQGCTSLATLSVGDWDTSSARSFSQMFENCSSLSSLDVSRWNTSKVSQADRMFRACSVLTALDMSNWNVGNIVTLSQTFQNCSALESIGDTSNWDTHSLTTLQYTFNNCKALSSLNTTNWNTSRVTSLNSTFYGSPRLKQADMTNWNVDLVTTMYRMFTNCNQLASVGDLSGWDTYQSTTLTEAFKATSIPSLTFVENWDVSNIKELSGTFSYTPITSLDLNNWDVSNVTTLNSTFLECKNLESLAINQWDVGSVTTLNYAFSRCSALKNIDLSNWDVRKISVLNCTFMSCSKLESVDTSGWETDVLNNIASVFNGCSSLKNCDVNHFKVLKVSTMYCCFYGLKAIKSLDLSNWDTGYINNFNASFHQNSLIETIDLSGWNISSATDIGRMFSQNPLLTTIYTSIDFIADDSVNNSDMFNYDTSLTGANGTRFAVAGVKDGSYAKIDREGTPGYFTRKTSSVNTSAFDSEDEKWIQNGDGTWTYIFHVFDDSSLYYFWEDPIEGYTSDGYAENQRTINKGIVNKSLSFTNTADGYKEPDPEPETFGSIQVQKTVTGEGLPKDETGSYILGDFSFTLKLSVPENATDVYQSWIEGTKVFGDYVFNDGTASFTLHDKQSVTFTNIPAGLEYTVTEAEAEGFTPAYVNQTGTVTRNETKEVSVTNAYTDLTEKRSVTIAKTVVNGEAEDAFDFTVSLTNLRPLFSYSLSNGSSFKSDRGGNAEVVFSMKDGESQTVQDIPVGATYRVTEAASGYVASYNITDAQNTRHIKLSANSNASSDAALSTAIETVDSGEDITVTFNNEKVLPPVSVEPMDFEIEKTWVNDQVTDRPESVLVYLYQNSNVLKAITLTAEDNWKTTVKDLPSKNEFGEAYTYTVTEQPVAGYYEPVYTYTDNKAQITNERVANGSVEIIHSLTTESTGKASCYAKAEVYDKNDKLKYTFAETDEPITIGPQYIYETSTDYLKITLRTATDAFSDFNEFKESVKDAVNKLTESGISGVTDGDVVFNNPTERENTAEIKLYISRLFNNKTQLYNKLPFMSEVSQIDLQYNLIFKYTSKIGEKVNYGAQSYQVAKAFTYDELEKYVEWDDELTTADGHKGWYKFNTDTLATFLAGKCPYEKNIRENLVWDYTDTDAISVSYKYDDKKFNVTMTASQTPVTTKRAQFKLPCYAKNTAEGTVFLTDDAQERVVGVDNDVYKKTVKENGSDVTYARYLNVRGKYGETYILNRKPDGSEPEEPVYVSAPGKIYSEDFGSVRYFQYWSIQTVPNDLDGGEEAIPDGDGQYRRYEVARCYNEEFNFALYQDYIIEAIYGSEVSERAHQTQVSITFTGCGRNQWNMEKGTAAREADDRIFAEFMVSYDRKDKKQLNTYNGAAGMQIKTGVLFDRITTIEEANAGTSDEGAWKTQSEKFYSSKYGAAGGVDEARAYIASNFAGSVPDGHQYTNSNIPLNKLDNKNRVEYVKAFANVNSQLQPTDRKDYVYRAYAYMIEPDGTTVTVSNPVYFTIYDIASIENGASQSKRN